MQKVKKRARIAKMEGTNVEKVIQKTICGYKAAPHRATEYSLNRLMFGREEIT